MYINNDIDYLKFLKGKKIYIFGAGYTGKKSRFRLSKGGYNVCGYIDNDKNKQGQEIDGLKVIGLGTFEKCSDKNTIIIISSIYERQIKLQLMESGIFNFVSESQIDFGGGKSITMKAILNFKNQWESLAQK